MNWELFFEAHAGLPRQGPGNTEATLRALRAIPGLPAHPRILDVGCGPGMQSLDLLRATNGQLVAVDNHQPFLDELEARAREAGLSERLELLCADMGALELEPESFDLVWGEGSLYSIGFENALQRLHPLLRPGGFLAASELTWLAPDPPEGLRAFWAAAYPAMNRVEGNRALLAAAGYEPLLEFPLPEEAWWGPYYTPLEARLRNLEEKHAGDAETLALLAEERQEIELYREHSASYGYVFYVAGRGEMPART